DLYNKEETDEEDDEDEKYPILSFLISLYKIFAWIFLVGSIGTVVVTAGFLYKFSVFQICLIMFGSLIAGIILLIFFYSCSEKLQWKIDVEKHLRKIK
ncbi:MAG: hypothetical protein IJQ28_04470, partial [Clostridia bacterium]|nr:hypothetical protein [Clostridia bacterium]